MLRYREQSAAMFGTNGFSKVSDRDWGQPAGALRKVRSDPVLTRLPEVAATSGEVVQERRWHGRRSSAGKNGAALPFPLAKLDEVTSAALASIEGIRSSMEHFQGKPSEDAVHQDPDALEDLQYRLACYRYSRRVEPPPPPLAMDPAFGPAPPKAAPPPAAQVMSSTRLQGFQPSRRLVKLAMQAEHRRLRLEAAKTKRQLTEQELAEKFSADLGRYEQRMVQFEQKRVSQVGGRRRSAVSLTVGQQFEERRKQWMQILAVAVFSHHATKVLSGFGTIGQVCLSSLNCISLRECGKDVRPFAREAALNAWRSHYAKGMQEQLRRLASKREELAPETPLRGRSMKTCGGLQLPLTNSEEAMSFLAKCRFAEDLFMCRALVRRRRNQARCLLAVLRSCHKFAVLRMVRHVAACVKRVQQFLRRALLRLKTIRTAVKAQMLQIERELAEKELEEEAKDGKAPCRRGREAALRLLPETWRTQAADSLLLRRRRRQLQLLEEWQLDMSTYQWEVLEWRRNRVDACPKMPPYPTHVPRPKELHRIIVDARQRKLCGAAFADVKMSPPCASGVPVTVSDWHPRPDLSDADVHVEVPVIEPLLTPKGTVLR
ncbi:unnamed protein product [Effrenium voratum]|nr:unnamed protein product [Effrenium voratum]